MRQVYLATTKLPQHQIHLSYKRAATAPNATAPAAATPIASFSAPAVLAAVLLVSVLEAEAEVGRLVRVTVEVGGGLWPG